MNIVPQASYAQQLFDNHAAAGSDREVTAAVMITINNLVTAATQIPRGPDIDAVNKDHNADTASSIAAVQKLYASQTAGFNSLVLLGEKHDDAQDHQRAIDFINAINNLTLNPTAVVFERGMTYTAPANGNIIRETNLTTVSSGDFGLGLSRKQRSMVVAGYLVLLHAGGNQQDINRDLLFFGDNHQDIFNYFDYFSRHSDAWYLMKEPRTFFHIRSHY